jgi:hypothetical protein
MKLREELEILVAHEVELVVIGGQAGVLRQAIEFSHDLDIIVRATSANAERVADRRSTSSSGPGVEATRPAAAGPDACVERVRAHTDLEDERLGRCRHDMDRNLAEPIRLDPSDRRRS